MFLHWEQYEKAAAALGRAVSRYGESAPAQSHYLLAVALINLGEYNSAQHSLLLLSEDAEYAGKSAALQRYIDNVSAKS